MEVFAKTFYCPDMVSQQDAEIVKQALLNAPGIESIEPDHVTHTVYVSCANQDGLGDIEWRLSDVGFAPEARDMAAGEVGSGAPQPSSSSA